MERYLDACAILALRVSSISNYGMQDSFLQMTLGLIRNLVGEYSALLVVKCHGNSRIIRRILLGHVPTSHLECTDRPQVVHTDHLRTLGS